MQRININGKRYYVDGSDVGVSVTEWLGQVYPPAKHLKDWWKDNTREYIDSVLDESSQFGTAFHDYAELYANGHDIDLKGLDSKMSHYIVSLAHFFEDRNVTPIHTERYVFHRATPQYPLTFGGTLDLECEMDWNGRRVLALLDYKTGGIYDKHKYQLIAYMAARQQQDPDLDFHLFNLSPNDWTRQPTYKLKHWRITERDLEKFAAFCILYEDTLPKTVRTFSSVKMGEPMEFEDVPVEEYIKNQLNGDNHEEI